MLTEIQIPLLEGLCDRKLFLLACWLRTIETVWGKCIVQAREQCKSTEVQIRYGLAEIRSSEHPEEEDDRPPPIASYVIKISTPDCL
jgi:hypothetical protein